MKYLTGKVYDPNDSDIVEGTIDRIDSKGERWYSNVIVYGVSKREVEEVSERIIDELNGTEVNEDDRYARAFNMWMDHLYIDPQAFETSYDSAMRHVSEKLGGVEPSYGQVAAEQFKNYLNKVTKIGETK